MVFTLLVLPRERIRAVDVSFIRCALQLKLISTNTSKINLDTFFIN
jgi:hypothetical protein